MTLDGVRPLAWLAALRHQPVMADKSVAPTALALLKWAPSNPRRRPCRGHKKHAPSCPECVALDWTFWASHTDLADVVTSSPRTMERGTQALRQAGYLALVRKGHGGHDSKANEYRLTVPTSPANLTDEEAT